jgi:hypothetical protein
MTTNPLDMTARATTRRHAKYVQGYPKGVYCSSLESMTPQQANYILTTLSSTDSKKRRQLKSDMNTYICNHFPELAKKAKLVPDTITKLPKPAQSIPSPTRTLVYQPLANAAAPPPHQTPRPTRPARVMTSLAVHLREGTEESRLVVVDLPKPVEAKQPQPAPPSQTNGASVSPPPLTHPTPASGYPPMKPSDQSVNPPPPESPGPTSPHPTSPLPPLHESLPPLTNGTHDAVGAKRKTATEPAPPSVTSASNGAVDVQLIPPTKKIRYDPSVFSDDFIQAMTLLEKSADLSADLKAIETEIPLLEQKAVAEEEQPRNTIAVLDAEIKKLQYKVVALDTEIKKLEEKAVQEKDVIHRLRTPIDDKQIRKQTINSEIAMIKLQVARLVPPGVMRDTAPPTASPL